MASPTGFTWTGVWDWLPARLGFMPQPVIIVDPDPAWTEHFERYRDEIVRACGDLIEHVEHVGSTSVPGLAAKPIIDIAIGVGDAELIDVSDEVAVVPGDGQNVTAAGPARHVELVNAIKAIGYVYRGENGIPGRLLWGHRPIKPVCHVHLVLTGSPPWIDYLAFRDYLRTHPLRAAEYAALKRKLADEHGRDRIGYTDAKTDFVRGCLEAALG